MTLSIGGKALGFKKASDDKTIQLLFLQIKNTHALIYGSLHLPVYKGTKICIHMNVAKQASAGVVIIVLLVLIFVRYFR